MQPTSAAAGVQPKVVDGGTSLPFKGRAGVGIGMG